MAGTKSLGQATVSGVFWFSFSRWISKGGQIVSAIVLARILTPRDFGLLAMSMVLLALLQSLSSYGIVTSLIQSREITDEELDFSWTISFVRFLLLAVLVVVTAPLVSLYFREPRLTRITVTIAAIPLVCAFESQAYIVFTREFLFHRRFYLLSIPAIVRIVVVLCLAYYLRNVWALVIAAIAEPFTRVALSYVLYHRIPRFNFDWRNEQIWAHFKFGGWVWGLEVLKSFKDQIGRIILGRLLGSTDLGYYQVGVRFSGEAINDFNAVLSKSMFPIYSKVQDDKTNLKRKYLLTLGFIAIMFLPIAAGLLLVADDAVALVLGSKWIQSIPIIKILALAGIVMVITETGQPLFLGHGKPKYEFWKNLFFIVLFIPLCMFLTLRFSITGTALSLLIVNLLLMPLWYSFIKRIISINLSDIVKLFVYPGISTLCMTLGVLFVLGLAKDTYLPLRLVCSIVSGVLIYGIFMLIGWRFIKIESLTVLHSNVMSILRSKLKRKQPNE